MNARQDASRLPLLAIAAIVALPSLAAAQSLSTDHGRFRIELHGQTVGTEVFSIARQGQGWREHSQIQLHVPGQPTENDTADLELAADGSPLRYHWRGEARKTRSIQVDFRNGVAQLALRRAGAAPATEVFRFPQGHIVVLDNNVYAGYEILARLYNWAAGGAQKFSVLIPQDQTPGTITVESEGRRRIHGAQLNLLVAKSPDLEVDLYVDSAHRLDRLEVPSSSAEIVRE